MSNHELIIRLGKTQKAKWQALKQVARLSATISRIMREEGVCVSSEHNEIFRSVLNKEDPKLEAGWPMWLLWQQQIKQIIKSKINDIAPSYYKVVLKYIPCFTGCL